MGEESRSKKTRTKRDSFPNSRKVMEKIKSTKEQKRGPGIAYAQKRKMKKKEMEKKKYDTEFGKEGMVLKKEKLGLREVRYRALAKLLRQIEQLENKEKEGSKLDAQQVKKLKRKPFIEDEIKQLVKNAKGDEEDEDKEEEEEEDDDDEEL